MSQPPPRLRAPILHACTALLLLSPSTADAQEAAAPILLHAQRLLDVRSGTYRPDQGLLITGGLITAVGPYSDIRAKAPQTARLVDLGTATVMPGLIDAHAHLLDAMEGSWSAGDAIAITVLRGPSSRALLGASNARQLLEAGFTTVRNVGHSGPDGDAALRDAIAAGWVEGPRVLAATRKITPPGGQAVVLKVEGSEALLHHEFLPVSGVEEARRAVREGLLAGADVIKVVVNDKKRVLDAAELKAIVDEAHRVNVRVAAHATSDQAIQAAIQGGVDSVEHGDEATDATLQAMARKGVFLVATHWTAQTLRDIYLRSYRGTPEEGEADAAVRDYLEKTRASLQRALKSGVRIVAGSDMWMRYPGKTRGAATLTMLESLASEGMPLPEVLRSATITAADLLGPSLNIGTLEAGKVADIIAVDGDPLADLQALHHVKFVMKAGRVVTPRAQ